MIDDKDKKPEDDEIEVVEASTTEELEDKTDTPNADERLRDTGDDDDDDEDEGSAAEGETPEQRSERRREERRKRKERQRKAEAASKAELQQLRENEKYMAQKLQQLEGVALRNEARQVDETMSLAQRRYEHAERLIAEATAKGDGIGLTQAMRAKEEAAAHYYQAQQVRERLAAIGTERQPQRQQPRGPDPRVVEKANAFIAKHSWIDPAGKRDRDSAVAQAVDVRLQSEGFDPTTDEYWDELEKNLKEVLPHKFKADTSRKGPPVAGGADRSTSGKKQIRLSAERIAAMKQSGDWEDPAKRAAMAKEYAAWDAANAKNSTR